MLYVTTDLHGNYALWEQIKNYLQEGDQLVYLGDAIDRGSRGFEVFMEMLDDDRVIFVKGNHEDIMYDTFNASKLDRKKWLAHWKQNGGDATLKNINQLIKQGRLTAEEKLDYINQIADLPTYVMCPIEGTDMVFYLTHAGFTPSSDFNQLSESQTEHSLLWNRVHIGDQWPEKHNNIYIIHGHTPAQVMPQYGVKTWSEELGVLPYANGHKINLDLGTPSSGVAALYCLNTQSIVKYFVADADFN